MKITIVPFDKCIWVDNVLLSNVDLTGINTNIHAIQWNEQGETNTGHIEYVDKTINKTITSISEFMPYVTRAIKVQEERKEIERKELEKIQAAQSLEQPITKGLDEI